MRRRRDVKESSCGACQCAVTLLIGRDGSARWVDAGGGTRCSSESSIFHIVPGFRYVPEQGRFPVLRQFLKAVGANEGWS